MMQKLLSKNPNHLQNPGERILNYVFTGRSIKIYADLWFLKLNKK